MAMQPNEILAIIVLAAEKPNADWETIEEELAKTGLTKETIERALNFTQIAWGRSFLAGMGITFSDLYFCFTEDGSLVESGKLEDDPYFRLATEVAGDYRGSNAFKLLALTSAELNAVNQALNRGSEPQNLVTAPASIFLDPPTEAGFKKAQSLMTQKLKENQPQVQTPWWRFWG